MEQNGICLDSVKDFFKVIGIMRHITNSLQIADVTPFLFWPENATP